MRCAHGAGVLLALKEIYGFTNPDIVVAASGNVGSFVYSLAGQHELGREIWTKALATSKFISFSRAPYIVDPRFLIDVVFKQMYPLDEEAFHRTSTSWHFAISDVATRTTRYISKEDSLDIHETMRASKAMPGITPQVTIQGRKYEDGALRASFETTIKKAFELGAETVIAIDNRFTHQQIEFRERVAGRDDIILMQSEKVPAYLLTKNQTALQQTFDMGYEDVFRNSQLEKLFGTGYTNYSL